MRTWDYRGFIIEPVLASLEHIFDPKIWNFFKRMMMFDKSAVSADINKKMLGKVVYNLF